MKILKRGLLVLFILLVVGAGGVIVFLDPLVKTAVEKGATFATGVETKVGSVDASPFSGHFGLRELTVANPPGFSSDPFLHLGTAGASWQNGTILSNTIEMDQLLVQDVEVHLERAGSGTNYGKILDNLGKLSSGGGQPQKPEPEAKGGKNLHIKKIEIRNVRAGLRMPGLPAMEVKVPSVVIDDFRSDGSTQEIVGKLTRQILQSILNSVLSAGKDIFPADVVKDLGQGLSNLGGALGSSAKDALKGVEGALKGAGDLFKKK